MGTLKYVVKKRQGLVECWLEWAGSAESSVLFALFQRATCHLRRGARGHTNNAASKELAELANEACQVLTILAHSPHFFLSSLSLSFCHVLGICLRHTTPWLLVYSCRNVRSLPISRTFLRSRCRSVCIPSALFASYVSTHNRLLSLSSALFIFLFIRRTNYYISASWKDYFLRSAFGNFFF